jgi:fibro-slime domain-containing protein
MTRTALSTLVISLSFWGLLHGCGNSGGSASDNDPFDLPDNHHNGSSGNGGGSSTGDGDGDGDGYFGDGGGPPVVVGCDPTMELCVDAGAPGICSDGQLDPGLETCDDGNIDSGDGCTATCAVEADFVCPTPGEDCVSTVRCGDDKITGDETCDDGNEDAGDGCSDTCMTEPGWSCPIQGADCVAAACGDGVIAGLEECEDGATVPLAGDGCDTLCQIEAGGPGVGGAWEGWVCDTAGMPCTATTCNDGTKEGDEPCDDGNQVIGDGCNTLCEVEPDCPADGGACSSVCGDGIILATDDEDCDDGNSTDGDGCSSACTVEAGYMCTVVQQALPASITIPFVFRDFVAFPSMTTTMQRHPDFQNGCLGNPIENMTTDALDVDGKPVNSGLNAVPAACVLNVGYLGANPGQCDNLDGSNGTTCTPTNAQRSTHPNHPLATHPGIDPFFYWYRDTPDVNKTVVVPEVLMGNNGVYSFNPGGGFFPLNGLGWVATGDEDPWQGAGGNNYGFTSEVRYWFQFQGGETLSFTGDDDLFVYANGELILPIGSKHGATTREVVINANGTATCAACTTMSRPHTMTVGNVYEMAIFHAERQASASNFNLSITGFVKAKSECVSVCGDGVVTPDEECDNGAANADDAYNGCTTTCERSAFCGDGNVNGPEACDDGVNLSQYQGCAPGCVDGPSCGDGIVQSNFEECDDGVLAGLYGGCAPGCILGPRCGDNIVQTSATNPAQDEECDDGNRSKGDGCDPNCQPEIIQ